MSGGLRTELAGVLAAAGLDSTPTQAARLVEAARRERPDASEAELAAQARGLAARVAAGEPLAYVTGRQAFMGIELRVTPGALVPRAETEILARSALARLPQPSTGAAAVRVIDMCCGSGNLACAIAHHAAHAQVWASDLTDGCVAVARTNALQTGLADRVVVVQGDLFSPLAGHGLEGTVDLVVCNPPYISQGKLAGERAVLLEHEPREAFDGGPYGLSIHQRVIRDAWAFLRPGGWLMFEFGQGQERQLKMLFERAGNYENFELASDANGNPRVAKASKPAVS